MFIGFSQTRLAQKLSAQGSGKLLVLSSSLKTLQKCHITHAALMGRFAFEMYLAAPLKQQQTTMGAAG